jgi:tyrosyl-tRNA synthetase
VRGDEPAFPRREPGPIWECGTAASGRVSKQRGLRPRERETLALARMEESSSEASPSEATRRQPVTRPPAEAGRPPAEAVAAHLARNAVDCLPRGALAERIAQGRPLRVKLGLDPTAPDIHLGHTVVLTKLREFQDAGHTVVLIVGDYTGRVGDPSGRSATRPVLSGEEIDANAETYRRQARKILRDDRLEVRRNSEWLDMPMEDLFRLARHPTVAQLLERDDFAKRFAAAEPISLLELLYPVLQGYDSVCVKADVELGGTDQTFNLLMGRSIQQAYGQPPQVVLTVPLLTGTDGTQKMSKSFGNHIGVTEPAGEMYGKTLRIPDEQIAPWFSLLLGEEPTAGLGPRDAKRALARALVMRFHGEAAAAEAEAGFDRVFIAHELPEEIEEAAVASANGVVHLPAVIAEVFGISRSEARRRLAQGGVKLDGTTAAAEVLDVPASELDGRVLQLGKRHFRRLRVGT